MQRAHKYMQIFFKDSMYTWTYLCAMRNILELNASQVTSQASACAAAEKIINMNNCFCM